MVAKSGWPVFGHKQVNSGHSNAISNARWGFGLANVSRVLLGRVDMDEDAVASARRAQPRRRPTRESLVRTFARGEPGYPRRLLALTAPPERVWIEGEMAPARMPAAAI